jgi:hypothetical protein
MPSAVSDHGPRLFLSECSGSSDSRMSLSIDLQASSWLDRGILLDAPRGGFCHTIQPRARAEELRRDGFPLLALSRRLPALHINATRSTADGGAGSSKLMAAFTASTARAPTFSLSFCSRRGARCAWPWAQPSCAPPVSVSSVPACLLSWWCQPRVTSFNRAIFKPSRCAGIRPLG